MRVLMKVSIPVGAGNRAVKDGSLPSTIGAFVERMKPEACYFAASGGKRCGFFVFDLEDPTMIPSVAEPFFNAFDAEIELQPAMNLEEMKIGVSRATKG